MQQYTLGWAVGCALQASASALVASAYSTSPAVARTVAARLLGCGAAIGATVCVTQVASLRSLPLVIPLFTPVAAVQDALRVPSVLVALLQLVNGVCFVMVTMHYYSILCSVGLHKILGLTRAWWCVRK